MTEDDLIREFGDAVQYYDPSDTTDLAKGLGLTVAAHKTIAIILQPNDIISDSFINIKIGEHILPSTVSVDSLSRIVNTIFVMPSPFDFIDTEHFNKMATSIIGKPDAYGNYYFDNCIILCSHPPCTVIKLTDHKMTTEEYQEAISRSNIQDEFFGIPIYTSYFEVKKRMSGQGYNDYSTDRNKLLYTNIDFAGFKWDFCTLTFNDKRQFVDIEFQQYSYSEDIIRQRYQNLKARLQEKYSRDKGFISAEDDTWSEDESINIVFGGMYSELRCFLSARHSESLGKDMYHYLVLSYYDQSLLEDPDEQL